MALIKAYVRENNSYRVSKEHTAQAGETVEVEEEELCIASHCLVSVEQQDAEHAAARATEHNEAEARASIFNTAREAAIAAAAAQTQARALTHAQRAQAGNVAAAHAAEALEKLSKEAPPKIGKPKHDKKPDLA